MEKKRKLPDKKSNNQLYIGAITFAIIAVYLIGYSVTAVKKPKLNIEVVQYGSIETVTEYTGVIIRDESVVYSRESGTAVFFYNDYDYVKKGSAVCAVKNTPVTDSIERNITNYNEELIKLQENRSDLTLFADDIEYRNKKIKSAVDSYKFMQEDFASVSKLKATVQKEIDLRNQILLSDLGSLGELSDKRDLSVQQLSNHSETYYSAANGTIALNVDNMESVYTLDSMLSLSSSQTKMTVQPTDYSVNDRIISENDALYKVVTSNEWFIASYLPTDELGEWEQGKTATLYIQQDAGVLPLEFDIYHLAPQGNETYVVLKTNKYMEDFLYQRSITFQLKDSQYEGIKIPNTAILEKTFLAFPSSFVTEQKGAPGILKKNELGYEFINITVSSQDDEFTYISNESTDIRIGDKIYHLSDKGIETAYELTQIKSQKGVYIVNSGIAEFKYVDITASNQYYSIVNGDSLYGVKPYDRIISDIKTLESEPLFLER